MSGAKVSVRNEDRSQRWADPETGHSPNFWGRSIGWWFMALVDALEYIPQDHSGYADMIKWTKELAETLSKYQDKNGLWYQVIDQPSRTGNFPEASVTTQCMYAYMKAVNKGYIDSQYLLPSLLIVLYPTWQKAYQSSHCLNRFH